MQTIFLNRLFDTLADNYQVTGAMRQPVLYPDFYTNN